MNTYIENLNLAEYNVRVANLKIAGLENGVHFLSYKTMRGNYAILQFREEVNLPKVSRFICQHKSSTATAIISEIKNILDAPSNFIKTKLDKDDHKYCWMIIEDPKGINGAELL